MMEYVRRISGSTLKLMALLTMIVDHIGAGLLFYLLRYGTIPAGAPRDFWLKVYYAFRGIGRTAFPIYCFLLVEGFVHTRSRAHYAFRLALFALLSEIPFDVCFFPETAYADPNILTVLRANAWTFREHQNVFWTLLVGLLVLWGIDNVRTILRDMPVVSWGMAAVLTGLGVVTAEAMQTDYGGWGVALIVVWYLLRPFPVAGNVAGYAVLMRLNSEVWAFPGFILPFFYNGQRGSFSRAVKYFFYIAYPAHLIIIFYLRCWIMGRAQL